MSAGTIASQNSRSDSKINPLDARPVQYAKLNMDVIIILSTDGLAPDGIRPLVGMMLARYCTFFLTNPLFDINYFKSMSGDFIKNSRRELTALCDALLFIIWRHCNACHI